MSNPRWLDLAAASAHLSLLPRSFEQKVKAGIIPGPTMHFGDAAPRWDRDALHASMCGGTGSTNARVAVDALAAEIEAEGQEDDRG